MKLLTLLIAVSLTGCATYINPVTGMQETYLTPAGEEVANVAAGALALGAAAALVGATNRYSWNTPYARTETCGRSGCRTTRYFRR